jgi:hypothetical protein
MRQEAMKRRRRKESRHYFPMAASGREKDLADVKNLEGILKKQNENQD